jgi:signal transduction histidine kinase
MLSVMVVPIFVGREWWGFIGFDDCVAERKWSAAETEALKGAARTLGAFIHRKQAEEKLRQNQEQLRFLASQLSVIEERERRRLATDLHDSIGQTLAMAKLKMDALRSQATSAVFAHDLDDICKFLDRALQDTRSLTFELSPPVLYELGIEAALESLVERMQKVHGIQIKLLDHGGRKVLGEDTAVFCFRAVQELLINVVKHARAGKVEVSVGRDRGRIRILVADDGIGCGAAKVVSGEAWKGGFGLFSIRERLQHLGGSLKIDSKSGQGTRVTLLVPFGHYPIRSS